MSVKRNRVIHVTSTHHATDGRIFHRECRALQNAGFDVTIVAHNPPKSSIAGVRFLELPAAFSRVRLITQPHKLTEFLSELDGDVYHFHDPDLMPALGFLARAGKKVVYDCHEWYQEVFPHKGWPPIAARVAITGLNLIEHWSLSHFSAVVTPTDELGRVYQGRGPRVAVVRNFAPTEGWAEDPGVSQAKKYDLIHVGTVSEVRLGVMLDIVRSLSLRRPVRFCLLGVKPGFKQLIENDSSLRGIVSAMERVPETEVPHFLAQSRIGLNYHQYQPRFQVAIPMKVFEYMRHGLPFVSSALNPLKTLLSDTECGVLVQDNTVEAFVDAVDNLLADESTLAHMGVRGKKLIYDRYNWETESQHLVSLYRTLLDEPKDQFHQHT